MIGEKGHLPLNHSLNFCGSHAGTNEDFSIASAKARDQGRDAWTGSFRVCVRDSTYNFSPGGTAESSSSVGDRRQSGQAWDAGCLTLPIPLHRCQGGPPPSTFVIPKRSRATCGAPRLPHKGLRSVSSPTESSSCLPRLAVGAKRLADLSLNRGLTARSRRACPERSRRNPEDA